MRQQQRHDSEADVIWLAVETGDGCEEEERDEGADETEPEVEQADEAQVGEEAEEIEEGKEEEEEAEWGKGFLGRAVNALAE
jgi:hypothetical protein